MTRPPVIPAEMRVPDLPGYHLYRPRLESEDLWRGRRLVLVTAGAGFGKTSTILAAVRSLGVPVSWCDSDETDADLAVFGHKLLYALGAAAAAATAGDATLEPADPLFSRRLLAVATSELGRVPAHLLVLDDVHRIHGSKPVLAFLEDLICYLPFGTTLVLSSREPVPLARVKVALQSNVLALSARDLAFRADEIAALFAARCPGSDLDTPLVDRVASQTEGWPAGLEIFLQALEGTSPDAVGRTLDRLARAGSDWFEYLAEQVLDQLRPDLQRFLCRSSVLPRLEVDLVRRLLRRDDARSLLDELVHRNLFTMALDGAAGTYRYHHLFRECLRNRLERTMTGPAYRILQARAARVLASSGAAADAALAFAESGDFRSALRLLEREGGHLLESGQIESLRRAFDIIPDALLRRSAEALLLLARMRDFAGHWREAEVVYRRALRMRPRPLRRIELLCHIAEITGRRGNYRRALAWCRKALRQNGPAAARTRSRILVEQGVCLSLIGRIDEGEASLRAARSRYRRCRDGAGEARADYLIAACVHRLRGDLHVGIRAARHALLQLRMLRDRRQICYCQVVLGMLLAEDGQARMARDAAAEALRLARRMGQPEHEGFSRLILGRCDRLTGDDKRAEEHFRSALEIADRLEESDLRFFALAGLAELSLDRGDPQVAARLASEAHSVALMEADPLHRAEACMLLGSIAVGSRPRSAAAWWTRAERTFRRVGAARSLHRLLLCRLASAQVPRARVRDTLNELLQGTARLEHDSLFLSLEPGKGLRVLVLALQDKVETAYAAALLARMGEAAVGSLEQLAGAGDEETRLTVVEILIQIGGTTAERLLEKLARGAGGFASGRRAAEELERRPARPLGIRALGGLDVHAGAVDRSPLTWRSQRATRLFHLLLLHRFRAIPRDQVLETLWPGADPAKAAGILWQAVRRLRQGLEPELTEPRLSSYVRFHDETYRLEPGKGFRYDVIDFEEAVRSGEAALDQGRTSAAIESFQRALELYQGDLFSDSPYEEFAVAERERLREELIRVIVHLVGLYARRRAWELCLSCGRRGLLHDPYNEEFHHGVVLAHAMLRHCKEALAQYEQYKETMLREMGLPPSPRMRELADRLASVGAR